MKKIAVMSVLAAILYSGCSDNCNGGERWCKNDNVYKYCNEEIDSDWREMDCNENMDYPEGGAVCFDRNSDGKAQCVRKCEVGTQPRCEGDYHLTSCIEKKYKDGSVGGVLFWEYCPYGCSVTDGVVQCKEKKQLPM